MVAFLFPPVGTVGSLRSYRFAKYFKEFNWAPTVLTVHDESCKYGENWDIGVKLAKDIRVNRVKGFYLDHIFKRVAHKSEKYRASINDKTTKISTFLKLATPFLLIFIIVSLRMGFDATSILTLFGNPLIAYFFEETTPFIEYIKSVVM